MPCFAGGMNQARSPDTRYSFSTAGHDPSFASSNEERMQRASRGAQAWQGNNCASQIITAESPVNDSSEGAKTLIYR
jgi:hypothetical protein